MGVICKYDKAALLQSCTKVPSQPRLIYIFIFLTSFRSEFLRVFKFWRGILVAFIKPVCNSVTENFQRLSFVIKP